MRALPLLLALAAAAAADEDPVARWDKPKRESFALKATPATKVAEEVRKRYGIPFVLDPVGSGDAMDFEITDATFFEALDRFATLRRMGIEGAPGTSEMWRPARRLGLASLGSDVRPVPPLHMGPSRLSVQSVSVVSTRACAAGKGDVPLDDGTEEDEPRMRVRLRWLVEPGIDGVALDVTGISIEDDRGGRQAPPVHGRTVPSNMDVAFDFELPSKGAKAIRKLEGKARVVLSVEKGKVSFLASEAGQEKALGGARVTLDAVEACNVSLTVKGSPCAGVAGRSSVDIDIGHETLRGGVNHVVLRPYDEKGKPISMGMSMESSSDGETSTCKVELEAAPARIELEAFVRGTERELSFSFADIPLPE